MVRLTGKHPFNAEAKLNVLFSKGFLTPSNLFFVRNHGAVPHVDTKTAREWKIAIHGLCDNPVAFTIEELRFKFEVITMPVTLVCAGNRRKEQNVVQQSLGFSWGAAGLSTALFTGVRLADVLDHVKPNRGAKHVIFEGSDSLPNGPYGTSQLLSWARDRRRGMMLAWGMNGLPLEPDHGFPLRLVVPGQIGGRSVKWLRQIELSPIESQHHLHFNDNKVLPMQIGPDRARAEEKWWYDPRYMIRDLNVNSAIACPDHEETVQVQYEGTYTLRGYAYAGGGRRITRVEVSINDGDTWELAEIEYPEDSFRSVAFSDSVYGALDLTDSDQCYCWSFWSLTVPLRSLRDSPSICVRAMDESLALQPRNMYCNATGMMNNWHVVWFRVCIHVLGDERLQFEHPTMAGTQPGGWMQRLKDQGEDPSKPVFSTSAPNTTKTETSSASAPPPAVSMIRSEVNQKITVGELRAHTHCKNPWFVVYGEVYDATTYLNDHPGGPQSITLVAGEDTTEDFMAIHSSDAKRKLAGYHIGTLVGEIKELKASDDSSSSAFLQPNKWKTVTLQTMIDVSKDSKVFRFILDHKERDLGLPIGQHVYVRLRRKINGKADVGELVQRAYTPISKKNDRGFIDMLVKIYHPTKHFPLGGRMTLGFAELTVDDTIELKGPIGHFVWLGNGMASLHGNLRRIRQIGLICGGSGITPILQVLRGIFTDTTDNDTDVWVVDINRDVGDILCRDELDELAKTHSSRLSLRYSLTSKSIPKDWDQSVGRLDAKMMNKYLPALSADGLICICGPPAMERMAKDHLVGMGWDGTSQIVIF
ncbi:Nitrate reductase [NADPH] [Termitomyces sp. J132]|nr:Nitrate reductase [NADPH] [Termitomyces sp. J132]